MTASQTESLTLLSADGQQQFFQKYKTLPRIISTSTQPTKTLDRICVWRPTHENLTINQHLEPLGQPKAALGSPADVDPLASGWRTVSGLQSLFEMLPLESSSTAFAITFAIRKNIKSVRNLSVILLRTRPSPSSIVVFKNVQQCLLQVPSVDGVQVPVCQKLVEQVQPQMVTFQL